jgi:hypothetical protein
MTTAQIAIIEAEYQRLLDEEPDPRVEELLERFASDGYEAAQAPPSSCAAKAAPAQDLCSSTLRFHALIRG